MAIINARRPLLPSRNTFVHSRLSQMRQLAPRPVAINSFYKRKPEPKIQLPNVTLWAASWGQDAMMLNKTLRVLCYCRHNIKFGRIIHFSRTPPQFPDLPWETVIIPELDMNRWNIFVNRVVPHYIKNDFAMSVHEDGFPLRFDLWQSAFLKYDYIGAPWQDGVVGNGGFNIESKAMLNAKAGLDFTVDELITASDMYVCRNRKAELEEFGLKFAPRDLALEFSTETFGNQWPSFGFHGRTAAKGKFDEGWKLIDECLK